MPSRLYRTPGSSNKNEEEEKWIQEVGIRALERMDGELNNRKKRKKKRWQVLFFFVSQ